jgi:membrane protein
MPLIRYLKQILDESGRDKIGTLSAALAYTGIFAITPLLLLVISVVGFFFGEKAVSGELFGQLQSIVGPNAAKTIQDAIIHTHASQHSGLAFIIGLVGTLLAAAALTGQLRFVFDTIFAAAPDPKAGFRQLVITKIKNAATLIAGSLVVALSVLVSALISSVGQYLQAKWGTPELTLQLINIGASLAIFIMMLYLIYRVLPDVVLPRKVVFFAAVVIGLLFLGGKIVLGVVIGHNGTASAYGAAASLITLLLWFYYTGQILFMGAEGIKVYLNNRGHIYKSKRYALRQKTVNLYAKNNLAGQSTEAFAYGFTKKIRNPKK